VISVGLVLIFTVTRLVTQGYTGSTFSVSGLYWLAAFVVTQVRSDPHVFQRRFSHHLLSLMPPSSRARFSW